MKRKFKKEDRIERTGPPMPDHCTMKKFGTIVGYGRKDEMENGETYIVRWDGNKAVSVSCYHVDYLKKVG